MFLLALGTSLTFGVAVFTAAIYTEGALLALRTAAQIIGWLFVVAALVGVLGLRRANLGRVCAASVTLCSGLAVLYMSYFFEWQERQRPVAQHAVKSADFLRPVAYPYAMIEPLAAPSVVKVTTVQPQRKVVAAVRPVALAPNACAALSGVESLQCNRCSEKLGFARVTCQESVRLQYCETELGDERTCPSPIPQSYPG